jgi:hypothetical protein
MTSRFAFGTAGGGSATEMQLPPEGFYLGNLPEIWARQGVFTNTHGAFIGRSNVSILGDILRAPASAPGTSTSLGGDLVQFGAGLFGNWANSRSGARAERRAARRAQRAMGGGNPITQPQSPLQGPGYPQSMPYGNDALLFAPSGAGGTPLSILDSSAGSYMQAGYTPPSAAPYVDASYQTASAIGPLAAGAVAAGARILATPQVRALVAFVSRFVAPAAAVEIVSTLIQSGHMNSSSGPYANPKHNKVSGVMRGDVIAVRRVKRAGRRLSKVLRAAGAFPRRARFRRRKGC